MSKVHILKNTGDKLYEVAVHVNTPAGNNSAGLSWQSVWVADGKNTTRLTTGVAPGNISVLEAAAVAAGTVMEFHFSIPAESGGATAASLNTMVDAVIAAKLAELAQTYKYYGFTQ